MRDHRSRRFQFSGGDQLRHHASFETEAVERRFEVFRFDPAEPFDLDRRSPVILSALVNEGMRKTNLPVGADAAKTGAEILDQ